MKREATPIQSHDFVRIKHANLFYHSLFIIIFFIPINNLSAQSLTLQGQAATWLATDFEKLRSSRLGLRYLPQINAQFSQGGETLLDAELSLSSYSGLQFTALKTVEKMSGVKPYRLWLRLSGAQYEARLGLQKINFGPARLLRSLMWFDRLDPRDPLGLTDGVYGLLGRYYFLNNANLWFWGLYGNAGVKGMEFYPTVQKTPEFGGRWQSPLGSGELAFSYHQRRADEHIRRSDADSLSNAQSPYKSKHVASEKRFAIDGNWDVGAGLWFELALIRNDLYSQSHDWDQFLTLGSDYTFDIGNGLMVLAEHFLRSYGNSFFDWNECVNFSGLMFNYNVALIDQLSAIVFYHWDEDNWYRYLSWRRTYDNWMVNVSGFWNAGQKLLYSNSSFEMTNKGVQIMVVFNH